jgi:hypothetical protein
LRDSKRVLDCLKKGVKIASQCMDPGTKAQLYTELLNKYIFFYEKGLAINEEILQELIKRVQVIIEYLSIVYAYRGGGWGLKDLLLVFRQLFWTSYR